MSPTFVVNPESLLKPEILISVLLSFLVALLSSTTTKKSPSASEVLEVNSLPSNVITPLPEISTPVPPVK